MNGTKGINACSIERADNCFWPIWLIEYLGPCRIYLLMSKCTIDIHIDSHSKKILPHLFEQQSHSNWRGFLRHSFPIWPSSIISWTIQQKHKYLQKLSAIFLSCVIWSSLNINKALFCALNKLCPNNYKQALKFAAV